MANEAFAPIALATVKVVAAAGAQNVNIPNTPATGSYQVRVFNNSGTLAYLEFGGASQIADATKSMPIPANDVEVLTMQPGTVMSVVGAGDVWFTVGYGV